MAKNAAQPDPELDDLSYGGLDQILGFRVRMAHIAMYRDFSNELSTLGLTQKQCATLWLVQANPGASQADLAAILSMDRATMMAIIDRLEEAEFVVRKRSVSDRRRQELYLTPGGQKAVTKTRAAIARHEERFTSKFTRAELDALLAALMKLAEA